MAMKGKSARAKGQRFERFVAKLIEEMGLGRAGREANSGAGFRKGDIACSLDFLIEAKNCKSYDWWGYIDQAKRQAEIGNYDADKWCLVVRDPRTPETSSSQYAVIDFEELLKLLKKNREPIIKQPDRDMRYKIERLKQSCHDVLKGL